MRVSIVLPAYNEAENLCRLLPEVAATLGGRGWEWEIIVVDDGSSDGTADLLIRAAADIPGLVIVQHTRNRGYGAALRSGFGRARLDWIFLMDADRQFQIGELDGLVAYFREYDLVIGYRARRHDAPHRLCNAWLYNRAIRLLFGLRARDIDCAFKLIRREVIARAQLESESMFISAELLIKAQRMGSRVSERPVMHYPRLAGRATGASIPAILAALRDMILFRLTGHVAGRRPTLGRSGTRRPANKSPSSVS